MKSKIFFAAAALFIVVLVGYAWWLSRERAAARERERIEAIEAADKKRKAEEAGRQAVQSARESIGGQIRENGPERLRLQRRYPENWEKLARRAGGDLSRCIVTASGEIRVEVKSNDPPPEPSLSARCGPKLDQNF